MRPNGYGLNSWSVPSSFLSSNIYDIRLAVQLAAREPYETLTDADYWDWA